MELQEAIQKIKTEIGSLRLSLSSKNIGDQEAKDLALALKDSKLTSLSLNLWDNNIGAQGAKYLADSFSDLKVPLTIKLERNNIGDQGVDRKSRRLNSSH